MKHIRRWGAVYVLVVLFAGSWTGQFFAMLSTFRSEQRAHGETFAWSGFWPQFWASTMEDWQSSRQRGLDPNTEDEPDPTREAQA